jgi:HK97 family phage major capsid protein
MSTQRMEALRSQIEARQADIDAIAEADDITPDQDALLDTLLGEQRSALAEVATLEARAAAIAEVRSASTFTPGAAPQVIRKPDAPTPDMVRSLSAGEARSAAMRVLDKASDDLVSDRSKTKVEQLVRSTSRSLDGSAVAKRLLLTESDAYRSAFAKAIAANGSTPAWDADESRAMHEFRTYMSLTDANGGFGVPVLIDPTIIVTSGASDVPLLRVARIEAITNDEWKGVSSAGVSWSFDAEGTEVSDDSPTLAQPTVKAEKAQGFIAYSIEVGGDYPGFASEMARLLDEGYRDLLANKTAVGSGTNEPFGIFTALDANTNVEVVVTTDGAFGAVDLDKVWAALPERYRRNASWFCNVDVENEIRAFGSGTATSRFTVDQTREGISLLNGKPVLTSDYAPTFTGTTGAANILVVGDFSNYLVAQRVGMTVEMVPVLFGTTNNRPTGQRGWYAYARVGADSIADVAFRLLQNQ